MLWYFARASGDPADVRAYLDAFPRGTYVAGARSVADRPVSVVRAVFGGADPSNRTEAPAEIVFATTATARPPAVRALADDASCRRRRARHPFRRLRPAGRRSRRSRAPRAGRLDGAGRRARAVKACVKALIAEPERLQALFQLGRALDVAGLRTWARGYYAPRPTAVRRGHGQSRLSLPHRPRRRAGRREGRGALPAGATLGNPRGRTNLGSMYRDGRGVPQDYAEAIVWYRLAGAGGWPNAIDALANMYAKGWASRNRRRRPSSSTEPRRSPARPTR